MKLFKISVAVAAVVMASTTAAQVRDGAQVEELWRRVEVIRTAYGVPHIRARDLRAAGYALAWLQLEDYGQIAAVDVLEASGRWASVEGYERIESDLVTLRFREKAISKYQLLSKDVRDVYEGFAAGLNRYIELHAEEFSSNMPRDFTGRDVAATEIVTPNLRKIRNFVNRISPAPAAGQPQPSDEGDPDEGSNAWAFAPSRTKSGRAILLRNPHLQWTAGYYEAHMTVPGVLDFYGDFRIGGPFTVIGGFNRFLGWSTTNNSYDPDEIYALDVDPKAADHYLFDGRSVALTRELVTVKFRNGEGLSSETREYWSTPLGPVIHRANGKVYVMKFAGDGEYRAGEEFLRMMRSRSLAEWKEAMQMRARATSNFTYADRDGNIFLVWNALLPELPHPPGEETAARPARTSADVWTRYVPFDKLPQFLNPPGGYIHNENNSPHYTNKQMASDIKYPYANVEPPEMSLRAQLGLMLAGGTEKFSLEDVVRQKHNYRMLLADRVKDDLIAAVRATGPTGETAEAIALLERWDNTASPESRGSTIFELWWQHYSTRQPAGGAATTGGQQQTAVRYTDEKRFARVWTIADPFNTPRGLADAERAVASFVWAVEETKRRYGRIDASWGEVHRVRRGNVDVPVGGCGNDLGCFRIMSFSRDVDGKQVANGGDGWVLAVEFGEVPRAYSVLAYGQSRLPASPWHADQAEMFARGEMKRVAFLAADVDVQAVVRFRPGEKK